MSTRPLRPARLLAPLAVALVLVVCALPVLAQSAEVTVTRDDGSQPYAYDPDRVEIAPGGTVTWTNPRVHLNGSAADHPTNCRQGQSRGECPWGSEPLPPGGSFTVEFPDEGTFVYFCAVHPYMEGVVVVGDGDPTEPQPEPSAEPAPEPTSAPEPEPEPTAAPGDDDEPAGGGSDTSSPAAGSTAADGSPTPAPGPAGGDSVQASSPTDDDADATTAGGSGEAGEGSDANVAQGPADDEAVDDDAESAPFDDDDRGNGFIRALASLLVAASVFAVVRAIREGA